MPWAAAACREAGTVHLGGTFEEVARSEAEVTAGRHPRAPVLPRGAARGGRPDPRPGRPAHAVGLLPRAVRLDGRHVGPDRGADRAVRAGLPRPDPGQVGPHRGRHGARTTRTTWAGTSTAGPGRCARPCSGPAPRWNPYRTALPGVYLCSASTPPGGGVHGMCGAGCRPRCPGRPGSAAGRPAVTAAARRWCQSPPGAAPHPGDLAVLRGDQVPVPGERVLRESASGWRSPREPARTAGGSPRSTRSCRISVQSK